MRQGTAAAFCFDFAPSSLRESVKAMSFDSIARIGEPAFAKSLARASLSYSQDRSSYALRI